MHEKDTLPFVSVGFLKILKNFWLFEGQRKWIKIMATTLQPVRTINNIVTLGNHAIEFMEDGSVDILDLERIGDPSEYVHLDRDEAYKLFAALFEQYRGE